MEQSDIFTQTYDAILPSLFKAQDELFYCTDTSQKALIKKRIEALRDEIIRVQLQDAGSEVITAYEESKSLASKPYMLWQIDFARVFQEKGGFDIVIGNPPYLESRSPNFSEELKDDLQRVIKDRYGKNAGWFARGSDLLIYFFELSLRLINSSGVNAFITQNSWLSTEFGKKFQGYLLKATDVMAVIDSDYKYFETADINTVITFMRGKKGQISPLLFARCHKNLKNYFVPANADERIDDKAVSYKILDPNSNLLREMKWGFIFDTEEKLIQIIDKVNSKGKNIEQLAGYSIGQGLNLKKSAVFDIEELKRFEIPDEIAIPFFVTEEGGVYIWKNSRHFIVKNKGASNLIKKSIRGEHELFDSSGTRKVPPALIMPRGIGARHFCCYNAINGYSASCVDVYSPTGIKITDNIIRLWLYMNCSLFWLIREVVGRTNLGGGMLKAEAVDIKPFSIMFPIKITEEIKQLFRETQELKVKNAQVEINEETHKRIDSVVFDYLDLSKDEREYICRLLTEKIDGRYNKTKAK